jgi:hypothetical protein
MFVICFDGTAPLGGYGDRVVGLISIYVMAQLLRQPFKILWTKESVKTIFSYEAYDFELRPAATMDLVKVWNGLDAQTRHKSYLMSAPKLFPEHSYNIHKFYLNQEIAQYVYKNRRFTDQPYHRDIFAAYKRLYTHILVPTVPTAALIQSVLSSAKPATKPTVVGIQVRAGDSYMIGTERHCVISNPDSDLTIMFINIKDHLRDFGEYSVFITSDYAGATEIARSVWRSVLVSPGPPQHLDKSAGDISKTYVDNYILSQHTNRLYISDASNYGRVAALSAVHDSVYSLTCKPLEKRRLLSKGERMF